MSKGDISAGIFLGRSTIEGLLCGKKALQFDVTKNGNIKKIYWHQEDNLDKFDRINVAKEFIKLIWLLFYVQIIIVKNGSINILIQ